MYRRHFPLCGMHWKSLKLVDKYLFDLKRKFLSRDITKNCSQNRKVQITWKNFLVLVRRICAIFLYNHANNGKGAKFGTKADIIQINNRIGGTLKLSYFWQNFNTPISHKGFWLYRQKLLKTYFSSLIYSRNRSCSWKQLKKLTQNQLWIKWIGEILAKLQRFKVD